MLKTTVTQSILIIWKLESLNIFFNPLFLLVNVAHQLKSESERRNFWLCESKIIPNKFRRLSNIRSIFLFGVKELNFQTKI